MAPSVFAGLEATDETTWCVELGRDAAPRLRAHWDRFITRDDFAWLADAGINAVRLPIGHWVLGPPYPYHPKYGGDPHPFVEGGIDVVDRAIEWAREFGLRVVLDLHAAPGCQNGFDNGGI
ncbi:MAG: glucan 1,3-beta-glucosidase, partial [Gammaproteobacteria bacterium]|nr:glucan 1,3-beta-glucosidase [Gammaproteobacteria bacterium]